MLKSKKNRILVFSAFIAIFWGILRMIEKHEKGKIQNDAMLKYYGAKNEYEIKDIITETASQYAWGANFKDLYNMLFEIVAVESDFGNAKDVTLESGEGLTQFDKVTFNELYQSAQYTNKLPLKFKGLNYYDLRKNPAFSVFMARYFVYRRIPHKIPSDIVLRARDWKRYYNTAYGKGTESHYLSQAQRWEHLR